MKTTEMYFEMLIIGFLASCGIVMALACIIGPTFFSTIITYSASFTDAIIAFGAFYVFGILFDRIANFIIDPLTKRIKKKYNYSKIISLDVWEKNEHRTGQHRYYRSKMKMLRGCSTYMPLITIFSFIYLLKYPFGNISLFFLIIALELILCFSAIYGLIESYNSFYKVTRELWEKDNK